eukprot:12402-Prymnesium_polylepis.1
MATRVTLSASAQMLCAVRERRRTGRRRSKTGVLRNWARRPKVDARRAHLSLRSPRASWRLAQHWI